MKLTVAKCSVTYTGRGDTMLPEAVRVIIVKSDGAVSIHHDQGNKPLNYMGKDNVFTEVQGDDALYWNFDTKIKSLRTRVTENLQIRITEILSQVDLPVDVDNSELLRDGTEYQLQAWLAEHPEVLGEGFTFIQREYPTGAGPVDLLVQDADGTPVAVEVKRVAMLGAVDQASRYIEALKQSEGFEDTTAIVAALDIRPNTQTLADQRGVRTVILPKYWNRKDEVES
jgi:RecB family endonuclease NucS